MRKLKFVCAILFLISLQACQNEESPIEQGVLSFSFDVQATTPNGGRIAAINAKYLLISVVDNNGSPVYQRKKIELYVFGDEYLSEPIEFKPGTYHLSEFLVLDADEVVRYATPLEGSVLAPLVEDPLPLEFQIVKDQTSKVIPQVIAIDETIEAEDFGYTTFSFDVVKPIAFQIAVFTYNYGTHNLELTSSQLSIAAGAENVLSQNLPDSTTRVFIKASDSTYHVTVAKTGFVSYQHAFSAEELSSYESASVLKVVLLKQSSSEGLVAYYPFSGNAQDISGNGLHGAVFGATLTTDRHGNANSAYSFDGNDHISVAHNELFNFDVNDDFSISAWAWADPNQTDGGTITDIIRKWSGDGQGYPFAICYNTDNAQAQYRRTFLIARYNGCGDGPFRTSDVVSVSAFHHIVMTKQGQTVKLFVDNNLVNSFDDFSSCSTKNNSHMTFGSRGQLARFFNGKIDDIRIYNRALSADDIHMLFVE